MILGLENLLLKKESKKNPGSSRILQHGVTGTG
jgi:hypothetical protein